MDREKVINGLNHCFHGQECCGDTECPYYIEHLSDSCCLEDCQENLKADALAMLKEQEAVVRCKDCKWSKPEKVFKNVPTSKDMVRWCELITRYVDDDWFCADGKRK